MATKAAEIRIGTTQVARRRRTALKRLARAFRDWGQKGQLTGYSSSDISRATGGRI
jgi:hypothetical protein